MCIVDDMYINIIECVLYNFILIHTLIYTLNNIGSLKRTLQYNHYATL